MANATFGYIQQRYNDLIGETNSATASDSGKRHINSVVQDILGNYPFSWDVKSGSITLSSGTATLPTDFYPGWGIDYAASTADDDVKYTFIPVSDIDKYDLDDTSTPVFWINYDYATDTYIFNSNIQADTITVYYHFNQPDMVNTNDKCIIVDPELVAYGAAAKNWIGDERNIELKREYQATYDNGVKALYIADLSFGPIYEVPSYADTFNWSI